MIFFGLPLAHHEAVRPSSVSNRTKYRQTVNSDASCGLGSMRRRTHSGGLGGREAMYIQKKALIIDTVYEYEYE